MVSFRATPVHPCLSSPWSRDSSESHGPLNYHASAGGLPPEYPLTLAQVLIPLS